MVPIILYRRYKYPNVCVDEEEGIYVQQTFTIVCIEDTEHVHVWLDPEVIEGDSVYSMPLDLLQRSSTMLPEEEQGDMVVQLMRLRRYCHASLWWIRLRLPHLRDHRAHRLRRACLHEHACLVGGFHSVMRAITRLQHAVRARHRKRVASARVIQLAFLRAYYDPGFGVCKRRIARWS